MPLRNRQDTEADRDDPALDDDDIAVDGETGKKKPAANDVTDRDDEPEIEEDVVEPDTGGKRKPAPVTDADDVEDLRVAFDLDLDDTADQRRSRRARRNQARRDRAQQDNQTIETLKSQLVQLQGVVDGMARGQIGLAASDIDGQIRQTQAHLQTIDAAFAKAIKDGDDVTVQRAMSLRDEARDRLGELGLAKRRLVYEAQNGNRQHHQTPPQLQQRQQIERDPVADAYADKFMDLHPWFNPEDPTDEDSQMVKSIDAVLFSEGYRPNTKMYWVELASRVRARGLGPEEQETDDVNDENQQRRPAPRVPGRPPTAGGRRGATRPAGAGFRLTPFMVQTLDDLGLKDTAGLSEEQIKQRNKYIGDWKRGMAEAKSAGKL